MSRLCDICVWFAGWPWPAYLFLTLAVVCAALLWWMRTPRCLNCGCKDWDDTFARRYEDLMCACCGYSMAMQQEWLRQQFEHVRGRTALKKFKQREEIR